MTPLIWVEFSIDCLMVTVYNRTELLLYFFYVRARRRNLIPGDASEKLSGPNPSVIIIGFVKRNSISSHNAAQKILLFVAT